MENSVYCSPTHLKLLVGTVGKQSIKVEDLFEVRLPEGGMINGIITNDAVMTDFFDMVAKQYGATNSGFMSSRFLKNPTQLVIHTNSIQTKVMEVPPVAEAQVREFIKRDFVQYSDEAPDDLYDYTVLNPKLPTGGAEILAASVGRGLLESYRTCLLSANYNLKGINIGTNCLVKLVSHLPQLAYQSFVLTQVDREVQNITLFLNGTFRLTNRYRLVNEPNTPEWLAEIANNLMSMLQFNQAQRAHAEVKQVYFAGLADELLAQLAANFSYLKIEIAKLDLSGSIEFSTKVSDAGLLDPGSFLFNLGSLVKR
ncbi:MAG: hypothetical protein LBS58_04700 [Coriobacteriales bacterium]|jgi:hypothetical protein|nr:hypothetical protein [Coriobacteriales bacterium]